MILTRIALIALLGITLISTVACSSNSYQQPISEPTPGYPIFSVIQKNSTILNERFGSYSKLDIEATIQNLGDDGTLIVEATCNPSTAGGDNRVSGDTSQLSWIYLEKGEHITIHFYFWVYGTFSWNVVCHNYPTE